MDFTQLDADFERMLVCFEAIAAYPDPLQRRFLLSQLALAHGVPRSLFAKLFEAWLLSKQMRQRGVK